MTTWVFTHGSLMADPPFPHRGVQVATVHGWRRTFGHPSVRNWGTPSHPAPTCSLVEGGSVSGVAYRIDHDVLATIEDREASAPIPVNVRIASMETTAATWTMTDAWSNWTAPELAEAAHASIAAGGGPFGNAADYLALVRSGLARFGCTDPLAEDYHAAVVASRR